MRRNRGDEAYLWDMLHYAEAAQMRVLRVRLETYKLVEDIRLATQYALQIVGEAANHISREFREAHPEIPWKRIIGLRHILAHDYGEVDDANIWRIATSEVPLLIDQLKKLVSQPGPK